MAHTIWSRANRYTVLIAVAILSIPGCVRYHPQPIDPTTTARHFAERSLADPGLKSFIELNAQDPPGGWPPAAWGVNELTLVAFYFHPDNIVSFLGAIIGVGIVAKNGILMLDLVGQLEAQGHDAVAALVRSARRRLRPILMTSLATMLAMSPMAWGIGRGADMLRPLAIGIIGALSISILFSLLVTPTVYHLLLRVFPRRSHGA